MRKLFVLNFLLILFSNNLVFALDDINNNNSWGSDTSALKNGFENQQPVSDSKLKETLKKIKEQNLTKKQKKIRAQVQPLSPAADSEHFQNFVNNQDPDNQLSQSLTVMIPAAVYSDDGVLIQPGYYKLSCRKLAQNEYVLDLTQGTKRLISVKAKQTVQDLEQDSIAFCNAEIIDDKRMRLVYGSIDLNLVGYLYFK